jgi:small-conductance mechanosensitive channel
MMPFDAHPGLTAVLGSLGVLVLSYVAARLVAHLLVLILARRGGDGPERPEPRVRTLEGPVTYGLFLVGAWVAAHRAPLTSGVKDRLDAALFVLAVWIVAVALIRGYWIFLGWYVARPQIPGGSDVAREFNPLFRMAGTLFIAVMAVIAVLHRFDVNVASLVVSLGVGSLAIGLAAQDTLANMFAGFTLMLDRPFRAGDRIQLASGEVGDVEAIGMRATLIKTAEETILVVPNSLLVKERLVNLSRPTRHLTVRVEVGVAYGSDLERVKQVLRDAALTSPHVDRDRPPVVQLARFGDFAVHFVVVFWARDYLHQGPARSDVAEAVYRGLAAAGIEIPQLPRPPAAAAGGAAKAV